MSDKGVVDRAVLRERRQITLPADICRRLGLEIGDTVAIELKDDSLVITPSRKRALDALAEIRRAFQESGVTEKQFQAELRRVRRELNREKYPELYKG